MENTQADQLAKRWMERFEKTNTPDQEDLENMEYLLYVKFHKLPIVR